MNFSLFLPLLSALLDPDKRKLIEMYDPFFIRIATREVHLAGCDERGKGVVDQEFHLRRVNGNSRSRTLSAAKRSASRMSAASRSG